MKICKRLIEWVQIINAEGDVRACCWARNCVIGNMLEKKFEDIYSYDNPKARRLWESISKENFAFCPAYNCPYLSNDDDTRMNEMISFEPDEWIKEYDVIPRYPRELHLAFEGLCNYECTCCSSRQHMIDTKNNDYTEKYERLVEELRRIMPRVKHIGANGRGELFCSPRTLQLLSEWKPEAPVEECSASLETNGSLFNQKNWEKIRNLGKYKLRVAVTVMSFDELNYQFLSGTKLPIDNIINNLHFIKELRDKEVINRFEIATVLQEANFRELPDFVRRSIEEFGADTVRIRPLMPIGGIYDKNMQWFMDICNPLHPYYSMYKEVMKDPIFNDPHVWLWSGQNDSDRGQLPAIMESEGLREEHKVNDILAKIINSNSISKRVEQFAAGRTIFIGGLGTIGKAFVNKISGSIMIKAIIDKNYNGEYEGIAVNRVTEVKKVQQGVCIITPVRYFDEMKEELTSNGFCGEIISLEKVLDYE